MNTVQGLNTNEWKWWDYLKQQSSEFLLTHHSCSNCLTQQIAEIYASHQSLEITLPRVEITDGSLLLEAFDRTKLTRFLEKLEVTCNNSHFVTSSICGETQAKQIVNVVCSILRNQEFLSHLEQASCACSLSLRCISIRELMGIVVLAAAARGIHFANCAYYDSNFGLETTITADL